jgi:FKBP-type peptidyl-prolyl cis-trans isomerase
MKPNVKFLLSLCVIFSTLTLTSCLESGEGDNSYNQLIKEVTEIDGWIFNYKPAQGKLLANEARGVRMIVSQLGNGLQPRANQKIGYLYSGWIFDPTNPTGKGAAFDSGYLESNLNTLIQGWRIAFAHLPEGSKATLIIPSYWGYGTQGSASIPKNATLIFDVELRDVFDETAAEKNQLKLDTVAIESYLDTKEITNYERDSLGIYYVHTKEGTGRSPVWFDKVTFKYNYKLLTDDTKIVSQGDQAPSADINSWVTDYIQGFTFSLFKMREGGKATFYIPSLYCFGTTGLQSSGGNTVVPANTSLILEIELTKVE